MLYAKINLPIGHCFLELKDILFHKRSIYQEIVVANTHFGLSLILDEELQSCDRDQELYHSTMILPYPPRPYEKVLVLGAGEGILVDKLLAHGWKHVTAVELDSDVIRACKLLPWNNGIYDRTSEYNLVVGDGLKFLKESKDCEYSYILFDLNSSAIKENCFEWVSEIHRCLLPNGALSWQDGPYNSPSYLDDVVKTIFESEIHYRTAVEWRFGHTSKVLK